MGLGEFISKYVIELPVKSDKDVTKESTTVNTTPVTQQVVPDMQATPDKKFMEHFENVLKAANKPGPDAFEYMNMLSSLSDIGLTEEQMYKAAWKQFKNTEGAQNRTVENMITDFADYSKAINADEDSNFKVQVEDAKKTKLGNLQQQQQQLNTDILGWTNEIKAIEENIRKANEQLVGINEKLSVEENKLNYNIQSYANTKAAVLLNLQKIGEKMKIYL